MFQRRLGTVFKALVFFVLCHMAWSSQAVAQQEANNWYFGNNAGVTFSSGSPVAVTDGQLSTFEGCASMSDSSGNLLFYTDGRTVYNRNHTAMANGSGLLGDSSSSQSAVVLPVIGSTTQYYIFTVDDLGGAGLYFSIVDMTLNGGLGDVTTKNSLINASINTEKVAIAQHSNGNDFWLLSALANGQYLAHLITSMGVSTVPVVSAVSPSYGTRGLGYMRVSADSQRVIAAEYFTNFVDFLSFNNSTGLYTFRARVSLPQAYGAEFSPSGRFAYATSLQNRTVVQYDWDVADANLGTSAVVVASGFSFPGALSMGPDGKMYLADNGQANLDVFNNPDGLGAAVGFVADAVPLGGRTNRLGLPTFASFIVSPPASGILAPSDGSFTNDTTPTVTGKVNSGDTVVVTIENSMGTLVETRNPTPDAQGNWTFDAMALMEGVYTVRATATNSQGDTAVATPVSFTVDTTAPPASIVAPVNNTASSDTTPTLSVSSEANATVTLVVRDSNNNAVATFADQAVDAQGGFSVDTNALAEGVYTLELTAEDRAGNTASAGPNTFTIDTTGPTLTLTAPADGLITNDTTPTVTGNTNEASSNVTVEVLDSNGTVIQTLNTQANAQGDYTIDTNTLAEGSYGVRASNSDAAGNVTTTAQNNFTIDTTAPSMALATPTNNAIFNNGNVSASGTTEANLAVVVEVRDAQGNVVATQNTTSDGSGNYAASFANLSEGTYTITSSTTDVAGNAASAGPNTFTVDTTAPAVALAQPTDGTQTNDNTPTVGGTGEANATLVVTIRDAQNNVVQTLNSTIDAQGNYAIDANTLADGSYSVTVTATDAAGNSASAGPNGFVVDTAVPAVALAQPADGTQTNDNTPTIGGTGEANATLVVTIRDAQNNVVQTLNGAINAQGNYAIDANTLADGSYSVTATATDAAGNSASAGPNAFTVDTVTPSVSLTAPTNNTVQNTTTINASGATEPNTDVAVTLSDAQGNVIATQNVQSDAGGAYQASFTNLGEGSYTVTATATDAAGNSASAGPNTVGVDTTAPAVALAQPTDGTQTNDNTPTIGGTGEANATLVVTIRDAQNNVVQTLNSTIDAQGNYAIDANTLADGTYTVTATATDAAGNSASAGPNGFVVDTAVPAVALAQPAEGTQTNDNTPTIGGTGEANATLVVTIRDAQNNVVQTLNGAIDAQGNYAIDANTLADGSYSVTATATDAAGNSATAGPNGFIVDTTPVVLSVTEPTDGTRTNDNTPTVVGSTEAGAAVTVIIADANGATVQTLIPSVDAQGNFTIDANALPEGDYNVTVSATDDANNVTTEGPIGLTIDQTAPALTVTTPVDGSFTNDDTPTISGASEAGASLTLVITDANGATVQTLNPTVDAQGNYAIDTNALVEGVYTITATATDQAGNTTTQVVSFGVDTTAPITTIANPADNSFTANVRPDFSGTTEPGASVEVTLRDDQGNAVYTAVVEADAATGAWLVDTLPADLTDGPYTVTAVATDAAGNSDNTTNTFTVDTTAFPLDIATPTAGESTSDTTPTVSGSTAASQTVTLVITDISGAVVETLSVMADANGDYTTDLSMLQDGDYTITATVTNLAGTTTTQTSTFTVDTAPPAVTLDTPANPTISNDNTPTVSGTAEVGSTVTVTVTDDQGTVVETLMPVVNALGNYTVETSQLGDGDYSITVEASDAAGNRAGAGPHTLTVDTIAPVLTIASPADGALSGSRDMTVTGTSDANQDVMVEFIDANGVVVATQTVSADANGDYSAQAMGLSNGDYVIRATATDEAGNTSTTQSTFSVDSDEPLLTLDTPTDGASTNNVRPAIAGTADADATIEVIVRDANNMVVATLMPAVNPDGTWSAMLGADLMDGQYTFEATSTRPNGKSTTVTNNVTIDTTPPATTINTPAEGMIGNSSQPPVTGTTEPGATVTVTITNAQGTVVFTGTVEADDQGNWSVTPDMALADGGYTVSTSTTDKTGNVGTAGPNAFTIDTTAPNVMIIGPTNGEETRDDPVVVDGVAEPGATVEILVDGNKVGEATADANGRFTFEIDDLDAGDHTIEATSTDDAGNMGSSGQITITILEPKAPIVITSPTDNEEVDGPGVTIEGTGEPGDTVTVTVNGETQTTTVDEDGNWSIEVDQLPEGANAIEASNGDTTTTVTVNFSPTDNTKLVLSGGGCSSTNGSPADGMWLLVVIGLVLFRRRRD